MFEPEKILTETDVKEILHFPTNKGSKYFLDSLESDGLNTDNIRVEILNGERLLVFNKEIWVMFNDFVKSLNLTK